MTTLQQTQDGEDGLEWLRHIRRKMSAECGHDPALLIEKLRRMERLPGSSHRIVRVRKVLEPVKL